MHQQEPKSIIEVFERMVQIHAQKPAIIHQSHCLTYTELYQRASRLASALRLHCGEEDYPAAIFADNHPNTVVAVLAALRAGLPFVLIDAKNPEKRIAKILSDSQAQIILDARRTTEQTNQGVPFPQPILLVESVTQDPAGPTHLPEYQASEVACLVYTSGSTGEPKGVIHTQETILHSVWRNTRYLKISADDHWLLLTNIAHMGGINGILRTLLNGATVYPVSFEYETLQNLIQLIKEGHISVVHCVPSLFRVILDELAQITPLDLPDLRLFLVGGETIFIQEVRKFQALFKGRSCRLVNHLGCTEFSGYCQNTILPDTEFSGDLVPVGLAPEDARVFVETEEGKQAAPGETGQLVIESDYLAIGYWNDDDLTSQKFTRQNGRRQYRPGDLGRQLPDGSLVFLGRSDTQVQIRGNRVELGEVERALRNIPWVNAAKVVAKTGSNGDVHLMAYLETGAGNPVTVEEVRQRIQSDLPPYMHPAQIVLLEKMPLNLNGKIDLRRLPSIEEPKSANNAPKTELESQLAEIWRSILDLEQVNPHSNFFDQGGNSLLAIRMLSEIKKVSGITIPAATFLENPNIEALARIVRDQTFTPSTNNHWGRLVQLKKGSSDLPPFFLIHGFGGGVFGYLALANQMQYPGSCYGVQARGYDDETPPHDDLLEMAGDYVHLIQSVQPSGPYYLGGYCFGGIIAFEMARILHQQDQVVHFVAIMEGYAPLRLTSLNKLRYSPFVLRNLAKRARGMSPAEWKTMPGRFIHKAKNILSKHHRPGGDKPLEDLRRYVHDDIAYISPKHQRLIRAHVAARNQYNPGHYPGIIALYRVQIPTTRKFTNEKYSWDQLARAVQVCFVPGEHHTMLDRPNLPALAVELNHGLKQSMPR